MIRKLFNLKSAAFFAALLLVWTLITLLTDWVAPIFIPSPVDMYHAFVSMRAYLLPAMGASLGITLGGFAIGLVVGIGLGLFMAYSRVFLETMGPFLELTRPIPVLALIPLFLLWFGVGLLPQILLVALGVVVILGVSTHEAVRNIPQIYIRAGANLGADKQTIFRTVIVPYIVPHLVGSVRVAAAASWGLDVASEFMGAQVGLGYNMIVQQIYLNTAGIILLLLVYSVLAIALDQVVQWAESRLTRWTQRAEISFEGIGAVRQENAPATSAEPSS